MSGGNRETVAASVNERLKVVARKMPGDQNLNHTFVQQRYVYERLLARLSRAPFADRWVLKGGVLMLTLPTAVSRVTMDMDWAVMDGPRLSVTGCLREICAMVADPEDGMSYRLIEEGKDAPKVIRDESAHPTVRAQLEASLHCQRPNGRKFLVDVTEAEMAFAPVRCEWRPTVRGFPSFDVNTCPWEVALAEKLHSVLTGTMRNPRLRDYMDVIAMCRSGVVDTAAAPGWIARVFAARGDTDRIHLCGDGLTPSFAEARQADWIGTLSRTGYAGRIPASLAEAITEVRNIAGSLVEAATAPVRVSAGRLGR